MNITLWILQIILALVFGTAGFLKATQPIDVLGQQMAWISRVADWMPRVAGAAEMLGAIGLLLPSITRVAPVITPLAAAGLCTVMLLAALAIHAPYGETSMVKVTLALACAAAFVGYGRWRLAPIQPHSS